MKIFTLIKKEFLEIARSKKLFVLIILFLFTAIASPIIAKMIPGLLKNIPGTGIEIKIPDPTWKDSIDQFVKNLSQIALIVIIFMFAGSISEEKNKKTLELILVKPISRSNFILAKFFSAQVTILVIFLCSSIVFYFYTLSIFGSFSLSYFLYLSIFLVIYLLLAVTLTIFFSTITSTIMAAGLSFIVEIIIGSVLVYFDHISNYLPSYILAHYKDLLQAGSARDFIPSMITSILLITGLMALSVYIFPKQEIER